MTNTDREIFLLGVIHYLDEMDAWGLDYAPEWVKELEKEYGFNRTSNIDA